MRTQLNDKMSRAFVAGIAKFESIRGDFPFVRAGESFIDDRISGGFAAQHQMDMFEIIGMVSSHPDRQDVATNPIFIPYIIEPLFQYNYGHSRSPRRIGSVVDGGDVFLFF
jgi:hypothetical protein